LACDDSVAAAVLLFACGRSSAAVIHEQTEKIPDLFGNRIQHRLDMFDQGFVNGYLAINITLVHEGLTKVCGACWY
jgi:hypothetical protein